MNPITVVDKHIELSAPTKRNKKITGTRFGAILGVNRWNTPFKTWCEITKTYQEPFEDTKYTIAGKTIEPKQAEYIKQKYYMPKLTTPEQVFGKNYFNKTFGDFYPEEKYFGGMWDYLNKDNDGNVTAVLEMKTTKRAEDWENDIPEYYALQGALYAYLLGVDNVYMVCTFLDDADYDHPEEFEVTDHNTIVVPFKVSERYPHFEDNYITPALHWWHKYVDTGISPDFDEKADADILKALHTNTLEDDELKDIMARLEEVKAKVDANKKEMKPLEDELKELTETIKTNAIRTWEDGYDKVVMASDKYKYEVSKAEKSVVDTDALKQDGLYEKYTKKQTTYTIRTTLIK